MTKTSYLRLVLILTLNFLILYSQISNRNDQRTSLKKPTIDDYNNYTTVGQIGMTVTNFGVIGEGWNNADQPSCRYKQYADIQQDEIEHFSYSGLWIGGIVHDEKRVSTA